MKAAHVLRGGRDSGIPGYFLSHVVRDDDGELLGVLVVKLELEELQRQWVDQPGVLLVADSYQVVILGDKPAWRFRALQPLDERRAELVEVRRYAEQALQPLAHQVHRHVDDDADWAGFDGPDGTADYLWQRLHLPEEGWTAAPAQRAAGPGRQYAQLPVWRLPGCG